MEGVMQGQIDGRKDMEKMSASEEEQDKDKGDRKDKEGGKELDKRKNEKKEKKVGKTRKVTRRAEGTPELDLRKI